jgi:DNA-binding transcriptional MerR regulator
VVVVDHGDELFTIGEVARRTELSVRTVRFYADTGLIPTRERSGSGHRMFDADAVARLHLVRTLRTFDIDLVTIGQVLDRRAELTDVAALHAAAIDLQIRTLRLRRAVLLAVADHPDPAGAITTMTELTRMSEEDRRCRIDDFWDEVCADLDLNPEAERRMRAARPDLPDDPTPEQVEAWVELSGLIEDAAFRARVREMTHYHSQQRREAGDPMNVPTDRIGEAVAAAVERARSAVAEGIEPASERGAAVLDEILPAFGHVPGSDEPGFRGALAERLAVRTDERGERYWQLMEIINGQPPTPPTTPAMRWIVAALHA